MLVTIVTTIIGIFIFITDVVVAFVVAVVLIAAAVVDAAVVAVVAVAAAAADNTSNTHCLQILTRGKQQAPT